MEKLSARQKEAQISITQLKSCEEFAEEELRIRESATDPGDEETDGGELSAQRSKKTASSHGGDKVEVCEEHQHSRGMSQSG